MKSSRISIVAAVALATLAGPAAAQTTLRIGLAEDPDVLDPTQARTFVGRIVFAALCDKLFDIDENLNLVPQLAIAHEWSGDNRSLFIKLRAGVVFHDGEKLDAAAVKYSIERHKNLPGSTRRGELSSVSGVEAVDDLTVKLNLDAPFVPLLAQLTDRSGMIVSPKAAQAAGANFGAHPVCAGPYKFVERVAQDRIVLEKFANYWNKDQIFIDRIVYLPIPDSTVRLANLQSGGLDFIERVSATDLPAVRANPRLKLANVVELGYNGITINVGTGDPAKTPLGQDARVRKAFELALDRDVINQVVYNGEFFAGNQWVASNNPFYTKNTPIPKRDLAQARALLREAGHPNPVVELMVPNNPDQMRVGEVIQALTREAGFEVRLRATEFATSLQIAEKGDFQAYLLGWSGRSDPDGNIHTFVSCKGPLNYAKYCNPEVDRLLDKSRTIGAPVERLKVYEEMNAILQRDLPIVYIHHRRWLYAHTARLSGFRVIPDGLVRVQGLKLG
ncbi:MAG: ABC transporter substrate-binding protein [Pseudomonadota bacterium]